MAGIMEDRHPPAVPVEDLDDLVEGGVGADLQLAQLPVLGLLEGLPEPRASGAAREVAARPSCSLAKARTITGFCRIVPSPAFSHSRA